MDVGFGTWVSDAIVAAAAFACAATGTALVRLAAMRFGILAAPNARSSHVDPTPTVGGLGFALPILGYLALAAPQFPPALALAGAGLAIATLGCIDDVKDLRRDLRLAVHLAVAAGCVWLLADETAAKSAVLVLALAWWINVYNFMDGIDGIAASQAILFGAGALIVGDLDASAGFAYVLVAAAAGFLCWNWAPARIFMGDLGSGFLGVVTGAFAIRLMQTGELPGVASLVLLVGFWFDASYTLVVRIVTRQPFTQAHRSHLYQVLARRIGHGKACSAFCAHAVVWLLPLAALAAAYPAWAWTCLGAACIPLAVACVAFKAGIPDAAD